MLDITPAVLFMFTSLALLVVMAVINSELNRRHERWKMQEEYKQEIDRQMIENDMDDEEL